MNPVPLWQVPAGAIPRDSPILADDGGTGLCTFIPLGDRGLGGWDASGSPIPGFPISTSAGVSFRPCSFDSRIHGGMALCHVDDGGRLHLTDLGGDEFPGWPVDLGSRPVTGVSALDLDSDGARELALGTTDGRIHLLDEYGRALQGWPLEPGGRLEWTPSQVTIGSGLGAGVVCALSNASIAVYDISGMLLPGWPAGTGFSVSAAPVSADLDADGLSDIIFATGDRKVHALDLHGARLPGWPYTLDSRPVKGTLAIGVIDCAAGRLQVSLATEASLLYLIDSDGSLAGTWRWPVAVGGKPTCPLLLSTWDRNTVLACTDDGSVLTWDSDGEILEERSFVHPEGVLYAPAAGDVDGNGITDIVVPGVNGLLAAYPVGSASPGPWPMSYADASNSGSYGLGTLPMLTISGLSGEYTGDVNVQFCSSGGLLTGLDVSWSTDAGLSWTQTRSFSETGSGIVWRSRDDLGSVEARDVRLRITPRCASGPGIAGVSSIIRIDNNSPPGLYLTAPELVSDGTYRIDYAVEDAESDVLSLQGQYSVDGGLTWTPAVLRGSTLEIDPWLYGEPLEWDAGPDLARVAGEGGLTFRMRALDADEGEWSVIEGFGSDSSSAHAGQVLAPDYEVSGRVRLGVRLPGVEDIIGGVDYEFSLDDGITWSRATISAPGEFDPRFYEREIVWESRIDAPGVDTGRARFRASPSGGRTLPVPSSAFHLDNNSPPVIDLTSPGARSVHRGLVPVVLAMTDEEGDGLSVGIQYRALGSDAWVTATGVMDSGPFGPEGYRRTLGWNSSADLPGAEEEEIEFRAFAADMDTTFSAVVSPVAIVNTSLPAVIQAVANVDPETGRVSLQYEMTDPEGMALDAAVSLSLDGGVTWRPATTEGSGAAGAGGPGMVTWLSRRDVSEVPARVLLRITPSTRNRTGTPRTVEVLLER